MPQLDELREIVLRNAVPGRTSTAVPRLHLLRSDGTTLPAPAFYEPVFVMAVQGAKRLLVGGQALVYDPTRFLLVAVDLPVTACIVDATPDAPYLCVSLRLDRLAIVDILASLPPAADRPMQDVSLVLGEIGPELLDPVLRLARLIECPQDAAILGPLVEREILYRLLIGPAGGVLRQMVAQSSRLARVDRAIDWIKRHFHEPMRIDALAEIAGMSPASLHRHFKAVTAMSPLQYQKQMRLQEARRRLVSESDGAGTIGFSVGYESQSQFSREYARLFGAPPARDAERLRAFAGGDPGRILSQA
ncbi:AraC family transcriptional regulator [Kaistia algarum]|uniref:AraC family transcriptional regulator n=1 Tax=Kaistia algarum TaxID=2083279 RepID=UPI000CE8DFBD|nr:AraC family transcriptional regulator [Kaistia algarum]MCX5516049.1 AraC family transcriptional regulator [Kaistia algarum]PPE78029.1 AraC family transcriptional regulator [Kaistia algarum]